MSVAFYCLFLKLSKENPATGWQKVKMPIENVLTLVKSADGHLEYDAAFPVVDELKKYIYFEFQIE